MAKMNIKMITGKCLEDSCVRYVIIYTNDRTIQGHHVYCLVSRVNIILQGKIQRVPRSSLMRVSIVALYHF